MVASACVCPGQGYSFARIWRWSRPRRLWCPAPAGLGQGGGPVPSRSHSHPQIARSDCCWLGGGESPVPPRFGRMTLLKVVVSSTVFFGGVGAGRLLVSVGMCEVGGSRGGGPRSGARRRLCGERRP